MTLIIHEFSTGIIPEGNEQRWVSKGFTGRYMNMTLTAVPPAVDRAIANHGFAVAEGASSALPAMIGRVVMGDTPGEGWSVITLVTRGEDEYGRSFGFHRYFLCQGADSLWKMIAWLETYRQHKGQYPVFNPFKQRQPGQPTQWNEPATRQAASIAIQEWVYQTTPAIVSHEDSLSLMQIHELAEQKANGQNDQIAWALNVEALERPDRFLVIKPASAKAQKILQQPVITSSRPVSVNSTIDEAALKGAIKGLINQNQVNEALFETLVTNLATVAQELKSEGPISRYWHDIFDKQGAANALSQKIASPQMVRLLALRAIVLPSTLSQYLDWLTIEKATQPNAAMETSLKFQGQLSQIARKWRSSQSALYTYLESYLVEGTKRILYELFAASDSFEAYKKLSVQPQTWAVGTRGSLWELCRDPLRKMVEHDLQLTSEKLWNPYPQAVQTQQMAVSGMQWQSPQPGAAVTPAPEKSYLCTGQEWANIWHGVTNYRRSQHYGNPRFLPLADVFDAAICPVLAACFYQIGDLEVPSTVYQKVQQRLGNNSHPFGIPLWRAMTLVEKVMYYCWRSLPITIPLLIAVVGFTLYKSGIASDLFSDNKPRKNQPNTPVSIIEKDDGKLFEDEIEKKIRALEKQKPDSNLFAEAREKFSSTASLINDIVDKNVNPSRSIDKVKVVEVLKSVLLENFTQGNPKYLSYTAVDSSFLDSAQIRDIQARDKYWIAAIYAYQSKYKKKLPKLHAADGVVDKGGDTYNYMLQHLTCRIEQISPQNSITEDTASPSPTPLKPCPPN